LELKNIAQDKLIKEIPVIVMLNKKDLKDTINEEILKRVLQKENLWFKPNHELSNWNPAIFNTCALYGQDLNIYQSFYECARRAMTYHGDFSFPYLFKPPEPPDDIIEATQLQVIHTPKDPEDLWEKPYCKHCGAFLPEGQSICPNCGKKVI